MLRVEQLCKDFGNLKAVNNVSFELEPGDVFGFIGPNGAGKTTTIKILATLLLPTFGSAYLDDIDIVKQPEEARPLLGYMPDYFGLYDGITAYEYLEFFAAAYRLPKKSRAQIINNVLELTDLSFKKNEQVQTLSRGMQQRLCLAKSLVHNPKLLLLDEPASGLDPRARVEIKELIKELGRMGKIIVISSHILPELSDYCNKIGIIEKGEMLVSGEVGSIIKTLQPTRVIEIKMLNGNDNALSILERQEHVASAQQSDGILYVQFNGGLEEQAELLNRLISDGCKVISFKESSMNLEDVFMRVTKGIIA